MGTALSFRIRDYPLITTAMFRSQNVYRGYLAYVPLRGIQLEVADDLGLPPGPLRVFIDVPHIEVADANHVGNVISDTATSEHEDGLRARLATRDGARKASRWGPRALSR